MVRKNENIYKRKDGKWKGRYIKARSHSGKIVYGYVYAKTYYEAKIKLKEKATYKKNNHSVINSNKSFSTIAFDWFESITSQTKESTQNKYFNILSKYILPVYGKKKLDNITYDFIEAHCNYLLKSGGKNKNGLATKTVIDVLSVVRNVLKFATKKGIYVPCDGSTIQIKHSNKPMRILSKTEQDRLCKYLLSKLDSYNIGVLICLFTGLRIGEICALRWEDVSFIEQTIYVHRTLQRIQDRSKNNNKTKIIITTPKSSCSIRTIPIPEELSKILITYKKLPTGYLLTNNDSKFIEPRTMQNRFKKALKSCNVNMTNFHTLRHTFATRCIELGFDVKCLSEILGHSTVNITMNRYVHPTLELKKENMKKLSSLLTIK